ncbi:MAG: glutathione S-transferase family protein [Pigmentiphaga sp.]|uniref:glutathione S-transferase family protein n=1 Tax=Pigmentiphaga sp. TaxID=1977564 RepID=UPI003B55DF6A
MELLYSPRSPYVRKVLVCAIELGVDDRLTLRRVHVASATLSPEVMLHNPLNKIPVLIQENGNAVLDSTEICRHLMREAGPTAVKLEPEDASGQALSARWQILGNGVAENLLLQAIELNRPAALVSQPHLDAYASKCDATLSTLERELSPRDPGDICMGRIAIGCALGYMDFRFGPAWRVRFPVLARWYDVFSSRESFVRTTHT